MRRILRNLAVAVACGSVALLGACTSDEDDDAATNPEPTVTEDALLSADEMLDALGENASITGADPGLCRVVGVLEGYSDVYDTNVAIGYRYASVGGGTDVSECVWEAEDSLFADMQESATQSLPADGRYDPAPIGTEAFGWEIEEGIAVDRLVVVDNGDTVVAVWAGGRDLAGVDTPGDAANLTRAQVDDLVKAAVDKLED